MFIAPPRLPTSSNRLLDVVGQFYGQNLQSTARTLWADVGEDFNVLQPLGRHLDLLVRNRACLQLLDLLIGSGVDTISPLPRVSGHKPGR
jgi:hypothetical protein